MTRSKKLHYAISTNTAVNPLNTSVLWSIVFSADIVKNSRLWHSQLFRCTIGRFFIFDCFLAKCTKKATLLSGCSDRLQRFEFFSQSNVITSNRAFQFALGLPDRVFDLSFCHVCTSRFQCLRNATFLPVALRFQHIPQVSQCPGHSR